MNPAPIASARLKEWMRTYYQGIAERSSRGSAKIAWCSSTGPAELLWAMGFEVFFPENHGAVIGAKKEGSRYIAAATREGYSPDVCAYSTADLGALILGQSPLLDAYGVRPPVPDVLVYNNQQCLEVQWWFESAGRRLGRPVWGLQTPPLLRDVSEGVVDGLEDQCRRLTDRLAEVTGSPLDPERLRETVAHSVRTTRSWQAVLELGRAQPAPWTFFDHLIHMWPVVVMRGYPEAAAYYDALRMELSAAPLAPDNQDGVPLGPSTESPKRVSAERGNGLRPIRRLYWEGMPLWFALRTLADRLQALGGAVVASTYCNTWTFPGLDPAEPMRSIARAEAQLFINRSDEVKERELARLFKEFRVDGVVYHASKTCHRNTNTRYGLPDRLTRDTGVPHVVLEGDMADERLWSQESSLMRLEAFMEMLDTRPHPDMAAVAT